MSLESKYCGRCSKDITYMSMFPHVEDGPECKHQQRCDKFDWSILRSTVYGIDNYMENRHIVVRTFPFEGTSHVYGVTLCGLVARVNPEHLNTIKGHGDRCCSNCLKIAEKNAKKIN